MRLSSLVWLGAAVSSVAACDDCGAQAEQHVKRSHDVAQEEIERLDHNAERREFERRQLFGITLNLGSLFGATTATTKTTTTTSKTTTTAASTGTGKCVGGRAPDRYYTASNGDYYGVCLNTDFNQNDMGTYAGITSPEALAELCSTVKGCVAASVANSNKIGYPKAVIANVVATTGVDSVYKISSASTTSSSTTKTSTTTSKTTSTTTTPKTTTNTTTTTTRTSSSSTTKTTSSSTTKSSSTTSSSTKTSSTTSKTSSKTSSTTSRAASSSVAASASVLNTILVIARDATSAKQATNGLNGYGIPFQTLIVPSTGAALPALNTSTTGNFGGIVIVSGISYYYSDTDSWASGLTNDQYSQLYAYQIAFKVRMVQWDVYPQDAFGTTNLGSCCDSGVEQLIYFTNTTAFTQAGLKTGPGAALGSQGLWHYNTQITDPSTTTEIARFAANSAYSSSSVAAVLNNFAGREQMAFFIDWATDWSPTSNYLQHAYITWMTRGLYAGYRRVGLNTQIDDVMLPTGIYYPGNSNTTYRITPDDMNVIKNWVGTISAKLNPGSFYTPEMGYNGNGNLRAVDPLNQLGVCNGGPIYTRYDTTTLEFQKTLGTGVDGWPTTPSNYSYSSANCLNQDPLSVWFQTTANRDTFMHISHTFTHEGQNNATYNDIYKEINWNQQWLAQTGVAAGAFTNNGIIPPAITGLHNGDALRAWYDNGIRNCVGDNSRPLLRNQQNTMWPYITTSAANGFDGMVVIPRWSLRIYYNCDTQVCTTQEWKDSSGATGDFAALMGAEAFDSNVRLFGLYRDGFMFHQLNLRSTDMPTYTTADGTVVGSLLQAWTEQTVQEFNRLANWPLVSMKQSDLAISFVNRMARDNCNYNMAYNLNSGKVVSVTVTANSNTCSATIPITVPGTVVDTQGFTTEKLGNDPLTIWVKLSGSPVTLTLSTPVTL